MNKIEHCNEVKSEHVGLYIRLGGQGFIDGLQGEPTKNDCMKIIAVLEDGIRVKEYRRQLCMILPYWNFRQKAELYSPAEYKKMKLAY